MMCREKDLWVMIQGEVITVQKGVQILYLGRNINYKHVDE